MGYILHLKGMLFNNSTDVLSFFLNVKQKLICTMYEVKNLCGFLKKITIVLTVRHADTKKSKRKYTKKTYSKSLHLIVQLHLAGLNGLVGASLISKGLVGISQLLLHQPPSTVSLLQHSASLLQSILVGMGFAISSNKIVMSNFLGLLNIL
jgi:hypothetical protein